MGPVKALYSSRYNIRKAVGTHSKTLPPIFKGEIGEMLNIILWSVICFVTTIVIFYLALSKNRFIPKPIKILTQFLLLPLHPYLKYGNSLKGVGGTIIAFLGIGAVLCLVGLFCGLVKHFTK